MHDGLILGIAVAPGKSSRTALHVHLCPAEDKSTVCSCSPLSWGCEATRVWRGRVTHGRHSFYIMGLHTTHGLLFHCSQSVSSSANLIEITAGTAAPGYSDVFTSL